MRTCSQFHLLLITVAVLALAATPVCSQSRKKNPTRDTPPELTAAEDLPLSSSRKNRRKEKPPREHKIDDWQVAIEGRGMSAEEARQVALIKAREALVDFLRKHDSPIRHLPPDEILIEKEIYEPSAAELIETDDNLTNIGKFRVRVSVALNDPKYYKLLDYDSRVVREAHEQFVQARLLFLGKILLALIALLSSVVCYARLEEFTKGYYTRWLRLAALGFLCAVGAGLWLFS